MKSVFLVDSNNELFRKLVTEVGNVGWVEVTKHISDDEREFNYILTVIDKFRKSTKQVMLINFSGKEAIVTTLGDECPDMLLGISTNPRSSFYSGCPTELVKDMLGIFAYSS